MNNPANVPPIRDPRFANWDQLDPTSRQLFTLKRLLREEQIDPAELYGEGFTSVDHLSRWSASWGIGYLDAAQEARYVNQGRERIAREREENVEQAMKAMIAMHYRSRRHA